MSSEENDGRSAGRRPVLRRPPTWVLVCALVVLVPAIGCTLVYNIPQGLNDRRLHGFAANLYSYPLPPETEVITRESEVTRLGGSNRCDFVARQLLVTRLPRQQIEAYYQDVSLSAVSSRSEIAQDGLIPVHLTFQHPLDDELRFTVALYDIGYDPGLDVRCYGYTAKKVQQLENGWELTW